jgi:methylenetetrahydrofolate reductase (NADPH)
MKITDVWSSAKGPTVSFELFPARSEKAAANLEKAIDKLAGLKPDFVSVTFGAGGSTREGSRQLIEKLKTEKGLPVIAYFACFGLGPEDITGVLDTYRDLGIENVLAVRGDPPHDQENFQPHHQSLPHATDLIQFIRFNSSVPNTISVWAVPDTRKDISMRKAGKRTWNILK